MCNDKRIPQFFPCSTFAIVSVNLFLLLLLCYTAESVVVWTDQLCVSPTINDPVVGYRYTSCTFVADLTVITAAGLYLDSCTFAGITFQNAKDDFELVVLASQGITSGSVVTVPNLAAVRWNVTVGRNSVLRSTASGHVFFFQGPVSGTLFNVRNSTLMQTPATDRNIFQFDRSVTDLAIRVHGCTVLSSNMGVQFSDSLSGATVFWTNSAVTVQANVNNFAASANNITVNATDSTISTVAFALLTSSTLINDTRILLRRSTLNAVTGLETQQAASYVRLEARQATLTCSNFLVTLKATCSYCGVSLLGSSSFSSSTASVVVDVDTATNFNGRLESSSVTAVSACMWRILTGSGVSLLTSSASVNVNGPYLRSSQHENLNLSDTGSTLTIMGSPFVSMSGQATNSVWESNGATMESNSMLWQSSSISGLRMTHTGGTMQGTVVVTTSNSASGIDITFRNGMVVTVASLMSSMNGGLSVTGLGMVLSITSDSGFTANTISGSRLMFRDSQLSFDAAFLSVSRLSGSFVEFARCTIVGGTSFLSVATMTGSLLFTDSTVRSTGTGSKYIDLDGDSIRNQAIVFRNLSFIHEGSSMLSLLVFGDGDFSSLTVRCYGLSFTSPPNRQLNVVHFEGSSGTMVGSSFDIRHVSLSTSGISYALYSNQNSFKFDGNVRFYLECIEGTTTASGLVSIASSVSGVGLTVMNVRWVAPTRSFLSVTDTRTDGISSFVMKSVYVDVVTVVSASSDVFSSATVGCSYLRSAKITSGNLGSVLNYPFVSTTACIAGTGPICGSETASMSRTLPARLRNYTASGSPSPMLTEDVSDSESSSNEFSSSDSISNGLSPSRSASSEWTSSISKMPRKKSHSRSLSEAHTSSESLSGQRATTSLSDSSSRDVSASATNLRPSLSMSISASLKRAAVRSPTPHPSRSSSSSSESTVSSSLSATLGLLSVSFSKSLEHSATRSLSGPLSSFTHSSSESKTAAFSLSLTDGTKVASHTASDIQSRTESVSSSASRVLLPSPSQSPPLPSVSVSLSLAVSASSSVSVSERSSSPTASGPSPSLSNGRTSSASLDTSRTERPPGWSPSATRSLSGTATSLSFLTDSQPSTTASTISASPRSRSGSFASLTGSWNSTRSTGPSRSRTVVIEAAVPTPPPSVIPPDVESAVATATGIVALVSMNPVAATVQARSSVLSAVLACEYGIASNDLSFTGLVLPYTRDRHEESPELADALPFYRGAVIGNTIFIVGCAAVVFLFCGFIGLVHGLRRPPQKEFRTCFLAAMDDGMQTAHWPSVLTVPVTLVLPSTLFSCVALMSIATHADDIALGALLALLWSIYLGYCTWLVTLGRPKTLVIVKRSAPRVARNRAWNVLRQIVRKVAVGDVRWVGQDEAARRWKRRYLFHIADYRMVWYTALPALCDAVVGLLAGMVVLGITNVCLFQIVLMVISYGLQLAILLWLRPAITLFVFAVCCLMNVLSFLSALFTFVGLLWENQSALDAADVTTMLLGFLGLIQSIPMLLELILVIPSVGRRVTAVVREGSEGCGCRLVRPKSARREEEEFSLEGLEMIETASPAIVLNDAFLMDHYNPLLLEDEEITGAPIVLDEDPVLFLLPVDAAAPYEVDANRGAAHAQARRTREEEEELMSQDDALAAYYPQQENLDPISFEDYLKFRSSAL